MGYDRNRRGGIHLGPIWITLFFFFLTVPAALAADKVYHVRVADPIGPAVSGFVARAIEKAEAEGAVCTIIELDTPGGLVDSMRDIVQSIFGSLHPVVVYVSPAGARAASAGAIIALAADVAAMAPGTNIGAAHPVGVGGEEADETMAEKAVNDMAAYARSIAERRGRNVDWAERAVRESVSITEGEALREDVVDMVAPDLDALLELLDGWKVPEKGTLQLENPELVEVEQDLRTRVLKTIGDPNIAYILMMIGLVGLYFELSSPGAVLPGAVGGFCLILAFFGFQTLPVNTAGVLLILLSLLFFFLELNIASFGLLGLAGLVSLALGSFMLYEHPAFQVSWQLVAAGVLFVGGFFILAATLVVRSHMNRPRTGADGLVGAEGVVRRELNPAGKVLLRGELWNARSETALEPGRRVRVVGFQGLTLEVVPVETSGELKVIDPDVDLKNSEESTR
ncbi:MAG: NfeD family protein [Desulfococcaceae bacterium]